MFKLKKAKQSSILIFILLFAFSCSKDSELEKTKLLAQKNFVDLSLAKEIASVISFPVLNEGLKSKSANSSTKSIKGIDKFKNKGGKISFYVINYNSNKRMIYNIIP